MGHVEITIQMYLSVLVVQRQLSVETSILIDSIEGNVFVTVVAIIERVYHILDRGFGILAFILILETV